MSMILEAKEIIRNYSKNGEGAYLDDGDIKVLKGIDLSVEEGEFLGIMGKSGGGKTTLLRVLGLLDRPTSGQILFEDFDTKELWKDELSDIRRRDIGFVFQDFFLMESMTVRENIILPMILDKAKSEDMHRKAEKLAEQFQITHLLEKKPTELSGGEKQRTAICRALINDPKLILADEPTGNLDSKSGKIVLEALKEIHSWGKTIIMVTHDPQLASNCEKVLLLKDGVILKTLKRKDDSKEEGDRFYRTILGEMEQL
nr:ABC transporter ATP-binding protein [uncultured Sellimonas sp.]